MSRAKGYSPEMRAGANGAPGPRAGFSSRLHIHYFYQEPLPNRYAASIQIVKTGAAMAARGDRFTYHSGPISGSTEEILRYYGRTPVDGLKLSSFFPARGAHPLFQRVLLRMRRAVTRYATLQGGARHVIMTRGETAFSLLPMLEALARSKKPDRPLFVYEVHRLGFLRSVEKKNNRRARPEDLDAEWIRLLKDRERSVMQLADGLVFLTSDVAAAARMEFGTEQPSVVVPSGVDISTLPMQTESREVDIVYAGKIELRKGIFDLCAAMKLLPGRTLAIAGGSDAAVRELRDHVASLGIEKRVRIFGWLSPAEIDSFLRRGRVGVCPLREGVDAVSDRFTSPMKLLQMMSLGLPVVATDIAPVRSVVTNENEGLLAAPNDPAALAAAISRVLEDDKFAARLGSAARRQAQYFAWAIRAERISAFLCALNPHADRIPAP